MEGGDRPLRERGEDRSGLRARVCVPVADLLHTLQLDDRGARGAASQGEGGNGPGVRAGSGSTRSAHRQSLLSPTRRVEVGRGGRSLPGRAGDEPGQSRDGPSLVGALPDVRRARSRGDRCVPGGAASRSALGVAPCVPGWRVRRQGRSGSRRSVVAASAQAEPAASGRTQLAGASARAPGASGRRRCRMGRGRPSGRGQRVAQRGARVTGMVWSEISTRLAKFSKA